MISVLDYITNKCQSTVRRTETYDGCIMCCPLASYLSICLMHLTLT